MTTPTNHFKVGLFVLLAFVAAVAVGIALGAPRVEKDQVSFHSYFDESVEGLEIDAPIKFRGVPVGVVSGITIAPDHRHIDVTEAIGEAALRRMGFGDLGLPDGGVPADLRAQLAVASIAGAKFVALDRMDAGVGLPSALPFTPAERHIPAVPSTMKTLEDDVVATMAKLPTLLDAAVAAAVRIERVAGEVEDAGVPGKAAATLARADQALAAVDQTLRHVERARLPAKTSALLDEVGAAVTKMNAVLARLDGGDGLLASVRRASDAVGEVGRGSGRTKRELDRTLREIRETAESIRMLADELERDPEMLLKGRAKARSGAGGAR